MDMHLGLQLILSLVVGAAAFMVVRRGGPAIIGWYVRQITRSGAELAKGFSDLFLLDASPRLYAHLSFWRVPLVFVAAYGLTSAIAFAAGAATAAYWAPRRILSWLRSRRMQQFEEQLVDAISLLANSARAGLSLVQALGEAAVKMPKPASEEFALMVKEYEHGTPIERVLANARDRLGRPNFRVLATALMVNRDKGGNLVEVLDKIGSSLREITRLEKKIRIETASVRYSAKLMALMPMTVAIIFYFIEPSSIELLFTDFLGSIILFAVVALNVLAMVIIQRLISVDV